MTNIKKWIEERGLHEGDYLGNLCRNNHEYLDTGKSIRCQRTVRKSSKSGKEDKNGRCVCCRKVQKDNHYLSHKEEKKEYYKKNKEDISQKKKEKNRLNMLDPVYRKNIIEYKRKRRREQGCELRENMAMWGVRRRAKKIPTVLDLVEAEQKRYWSERAKTPEGRAEYQKHLYKTSWKYNFMQREKNQRKKSRLKGNYVEKKSPEQLRDRLLAFDNCCAYCNKVLIFSTVEFDHVVPTGSNGPDILANLVPSCHECNMDKRDKDMEGWFKSQVFYSEKQLKKIKEVLALAFAVIAQ